MILGSLYISLGNSGISDTLRCSFRVWLTAKEAIVHIPDGYLSPIFSLGTGIAMLPSWALAVRKVRSVLNNRTIPLLAVFASFCFVVMMFNIPVIGGTTAHAVGGSLIAVVLGPWAACICVSVVLIIQALFFGDGGIIAILPNCLNMAVILPFTSYFVYRLFAGNHLSSPTRRVWAAGIGAYAGLTLSALAVGIELGVQPLLFSENGHALYSPYVLEASIPAMLISHLFGASLVEGLITALGLAFLQERAPEYLQSIRLLPGVASEEPGRVSRIPLWARIVGASVIMLLVLFCAGLFASGGDLAHLFGADWASVNWPDVVLMLLVVAVMAIVLLPLAWFLLPRRIKRVGTAFLAVALIAPLGLITPGFAYGEGSAEDIANAFGYIPQGFEQFAQIFSAPFADYNVSVPFFDNAALWHQAIGYEIAGLIGLIVLGLIMLGLGYLLRKRSPVSGTDCKREQAAVGNSNHE